MSDTRFSVVEHGFRFENAFDVRETLRTALLRQKQPDDAVDQAPYGLCGGMCFAALDYFYAQKAVPSFRKVNEVSPELLIYLWVRQLDTLKYPVLAKVLVWSTLRSDSSLARSVATWEVPKLQKKIDAGEPTVLALIRARGVGAVTHNHQVVATGYDYDPATKDMLIRLYDPNHPYNPSHPNDSATLTLNIATPSQGINLMHVPDGALRGFFVIDYARKTPPEVA